MWPAEVKKSTLSKPPVAVLLFLTTITMATSTYTRSTAATVNTYRQKSGPGNVLYRNQGNGTFADVTSLAGVGDRSWGMGCTVGDIDGDGYRDLYVTNYGPNVLYRNQGNGTLWTFLLG